ncbi:Phage-related baseplate assembly protein [Planctomycetes bacterium Pan216]|uniref:Phage-related baseplate assembly protein n=1 Tax=Kolteria novifilia TaxID=2527975 RepID=A0A518B4B0_9BACT|nr:Phage-related baseplate assembly protein [Planctomycetes bacterium Pan216]
MIAEDIIPLTMIAPVLPDVRIVGFEGTEAVSTPFEFQVDLQVPLAGEEPFEKLLGQPMTIRVGDDGASGRRFDGVVCEVSETERDDVHRYLRAVLVPTLWFATQTRRSRIFQNKTVAEIAQEVLVGVELDVSRLLHEYEPHHYCVQFQESDFDFVSRLFEEEGIYYYFDHQGERHRMILGDDSKLAAEVAPSTTIAFQPKSDSFGTIRSWRKSQRVRPQRFAHRDFSFQAAKKSWQAEDRTTGTVRVGSIEHKLDQPGLAHCERDLVGDVSHRFEGNGDSAALARRVTAAGERLVAVDKEAQLAEAIVIEGNGRAAMMVPGYRFKLSQHPDADDAYFVTKVRHRFRAQGELAGKDESRAYENDFACAPLGLAFRPSRTTVRPRIDGVQTATVAGHEGEEINTDEYGRVKVRFHWDRDARDDFSRSCWIRVGQMWAGEKWGSINIPRVGQEVIVSFVDGDPDQPLIVGSLYNSECPPPYELPRERNKFGIRSHSKSGDPGNYNELMFDDTLGEERVNLHAERDLEVVAENSQIVRIGPGAWNESIDTESMAPTRVRPRPASEEGGSAESVTDKEACYDIDVDGWHRMHVSGFSEETIDGDHSMVVKGDSSEVHEGDREEKTTGKYTIDWGPEYVSHYLVKVDFVTGFKSTVQAAVDLRAYAGIIVQAKFTGSLSFTTPLETKFYLGANLTLVIGNYSKFIIGTKMDLVTGNKMDVIAGKNLKFVQGLKGDYILGFKADYVVGNKMSNVIKKSDVIASSDVTAAITWFNSLQNQSQSLLTRAVSLYTHT